MELDINKQLTADIARDKISAAKMLKKYKEVFEIIELCKISKFSKDFLYEEDNLYNEICDYIIGLNINSEYNTIQQLFLDIYKYIPEDKKKIRNILLNEYEKSRGEIYLKSFPRLLNVVLTNKCNLSCIMCNDNVGDFLLSDKYVDSLIDIMPYLERISLRGGEVFLHKRLYKILDEVSKNNVKIEIVTNGLLLDEKIINKLIDNNIEITFSIDSIDKKVYESIRLGANFEKLLYNLTLFNRIKKEKQSKATKRLAVVIMRRNYKEIENILNFAKIYEFSEINLIPVYGSYIGKDENFFDYGIDYDIIKNLSDKYTIFSKIANEYGIKLNNMLPMCYDNKNNVKLISKTDVDFRSKKNIELAIEKDKNTVNKYQVNSIFCHAPWEQMFIHREDVVVPTCICPILNYIPNAAEEAKDTISNFILKNWNGSVMLNYRNNILSKLYGNLCAKDCLNDKNRDMFKKSLKL